MEFSFKILDEFTKPLKEMQKSLQGLQKELKGTSKASIEAFAEMGKSAVEVSTIAAGAFLGLAAGFSAVAIEASEFKTQNLLAIESMGMGKQAAENELDALQRMARGTKTTADQMISDFKRLQVLGFSAGRAEDVLAAASDILAIQGAAEKEVLLDTFANMKATGTLTERNIKALRPIAGTGPKALNEYLAKQHGTTVKGIEGMIKAGQISDIEATNAILHLIQQNVDKGGSLGAVSKKISAESVTVQFKNLKDAFNDLFEDVNTGGFAKFLSTLTSLFDKASPSGKALSEAFQHLGKAFGQMITPGKDGTSLIEKLINLIAKAVDGFARLMESNIGGFFSTIMLPIQATFDLFRDNQYLIDGAKILFYALGGAVAAVAIGVSGLVGAVVLAISAIGMFWDGLKRWGELLGNLAFQAVQFGANIIDGLVNGIMSGIAKVKSAVSSVVDTVKNGITSALGIHSPSRFMIEMGQYTAEGFSIGMDNKAPDYNALMPKQADITAGTASGGGSGSISVGDITINLASTAATTTETARDIAAQVRSEIVRHLEGLAQEAY